MEKLRVTRMLLRTCEGSAHDDPVGGPRRQQVQLAELGQEGQGGGGADSNVVLGGGAVHLPTQLSLVNDNSITLSYATVTEPIYTSVLS